jgi:hypothetical protein
MSKSEETLEIYKLIIGEEEAEAEAEDTISKYLIERATLFGNRLGYTNRKVKEVDLVEDALSGGWVLTCFCERNY